jgi:hypothetical protein
MDQSQRYIKHVLTQESMTQIANQISGKLERQLDGYETEELLSYSRKQKNKDWKHRHNGKLMSVRQIREALAYQFWLDQLGGYETLPKEEQAKLRGSSGKGGSAGAPFKYKSAQSDVKEILKAYTGSKADGYDVDFDELDQVDEDGYPFDPSKEENIDIFEEGGTIGNIGTLEVIERVLKVDEIGIVHEIGNVEKLFGATDKFQLQQILNPQAQRRSAYISMDSKYRLTSNGGTDSIVWNFLNNSAINAQGAVNSIGVVQNLVAIKVNRIRIPYLDSADNTHKKITMLIEEFRAQSYIGQENRRYHFQFSPEIDGNQINLIPWPGGIETGKFNFRTPITQLNTLTVSFGAPLTSILFEKDRLQAAVTHTANGLFTVTEPHNLLTGDVVSFTDFTSLTPAVDEQVLNLVNAPEGNNVVVIDAFNFEINVDLTAIINPLAPQVVFVYFESKRVIIDMELIYEESAPEY